MKKYPLEKYTFYKSNKNEVIAVSTYGGKIVRGVAKCDPQDTFDEETGKKLAAARCNARVAAKRKARATRLVKEAETEFQVAKARYEKMMHYYADACSEYNVARQEASTLAKEL